MWHYFFKFMTYFMNWSRWIIMNYQPHNVSQFKQLMVTSRQLFKHTLFHYSAIYLLGLPNPLRSSALLCKFWVRCTKCRFNRAQDSCSSSILDKSCKKSWEQWITFHAWVSSGGNVAPWFQNFSFWVFFQCLFCV